MKRRIVTVSMVLAGFALQAVAYLVLGSPFGTPSGPRISNPRVPFSPLLFIAGVMLVFLAAVVYELMPDRERRR